MASTMLELQEHCAVLSRVLGELAVEDARTCIKSGDTLTFDVAGDWLELASGVGEVTILTKRFDDCLMYCGSAMEYEDARSELLSRLATQLAIFQFTWGAFETVAKILDPPVIPPSLRMNGDNGFIARTIYYLKLATPIAEYTHIIDILRQSLVSSPKHPASLLSEPLPPYMSREGVGLDFVRRIRNRFAHGAATFPHPHSTEDGWSGKRTGDPRLIGLPTRIILLTIQMLLATFYRGHTLELAILYDEEGMRKEADLQIVLNTLHTDYRLPAKDQ